MSPLRAADVNSGRAPVTPRGDDCDYVGRPGDNDTQSEPDRSGLDVSNAAAELAAEVGLSTMAAYTHFGGMAELVQNLVREGFTCLDRDLAAVAVTDDQVADFFALGMAYRGHALVHPQLYRLMFGLGPRNGGPSGARSIGTYSSRSLATSPRGARVEHVLGPLAMNMLVGMGDEPDRVRLPAGEE